MGTNGKEEKKLAAIVCHKNLLAVVCWGSFHFTRPWVSRHNRIYGHHAVGHPKYPLNIINRRFYMANIIHKELSYKLINMAYTVHNILGPGLLESAYKGAMCVELTRAGIAFERQRVYPRHAWMH
jgi:hypothetical protein